MTHAESPSLRKASLCEIGFEGKEREGSRGRKEDESILLKHMDSNCFVQVKVE
jgi:hypothetical protein